MCVGVGGGGGEEKNCHWPKNSYCGSCGVLTGSSTLVINSNQPCNLFNNANCGTIAMLPHSVLPLDLSAVWSMLFLPPVFLCRVMSDL